MTADILRSLQKKIPCEPFRLVLKSGQTYDVLHPSFMWVWAGKVFVGTRGDIVEGVVDRHEILQLSQVDDAVPLTKTPA